MKRKHFRTWIFAGGASRIVLPALVALVLSPTLAGCRQGKDSDNAPAAVRIINTVAESDSVAVAVGTHSIDGSVKYGESSGYEGVQPGRYIVAVTASRNSSRLALPPESVNVEDGMRYTGIAMGDASGSRRPALMVISEPKGIHPAAQDQARVRVFNAAGGLGKVDFLINNIVAFKNVGYGERSAAVSLAALPYEWSLKVSGDNFEPLETPTTITLKPGRSYLVVVYGNPAAGTLEIKAFEG